MCIAAPGPGRSPRPAIIAAPVPTYICSIVLPLQLYRQPWPSPLQVGFALLRLAQLLTSVLSNKDGRLAALPDRDDVLLPLMLASAGLASLTAGRDASVSVPWPQHCKLILNRWFLPASCDMSSHWALIDPARVTCFRPRRLAHLFACTDMQSALLTDSHGHLGGTSAVGAKEV